VKFQFSKFLEVLMKSKINALVATISVISLLAGCATAGKDVTASYVSPAQFSNLDCDQLRGEMGRLSGRVNQLTGRLDEAASNDKALVAGGFLFFPVWFALGGTKQQEAELSRLKGEYDAIQSANTQKKCS
jgi:outer membrane murein-binding lipoprotein Lpp